MSIILGNSFGGGKEYFMNSRKIPFTKMNEPVNRSQYYVFKDDKIKNIHYLSLDMLRNVCPSKFFTK